MKHSVLLTISSLLSVLLFTVHLAHDMVYGWEPGTLGNLYALPICVLLLYGTLLLRNRLSGYIIMFLGAVMSLGVPAIHMSGKGIGTASRVAAMGGHFFFVWSLLMLGVSGLFSLVLVVRALWLREWRHPSAD